MTVLREHLSAWAVVVLLAAAAWLAFDLGGSEESAQAGAVMACTGRPTAPALVQLPRGDAWTPDARLAGLPGDEGSDVSADEVAEALSLERHRGGAVLTDLAAAQADRAGGALGLC